MRNRGGQLDMAHAVAAHLGERHLYAAFLTNNAAILHALVLAAQAFIILDRSENPSAKQPVALGLECPVVDRLWFFDLAIGPGVNALRAGDRDADLIEALRPADLAENVHQFVHQRPLLWSVVMRATARGSRVWPRAVAEVTE